MIGSKVLSLLAVAAILGMLVAVIPAQSTLAAPAVQLTPASGAAGTMITVTGTNFESYKGDSLSIFFGGVEIITSPVTVPDNGRLETSFEVPVGTSPGMVVVSVIGPLGSTLTNASFMVEAPEIWLDTDSGVVGTSTTIIARGFYVDRIVAFYYNHNGVTTLLGTAVADATGECSYTFVVPSGYAGEHRITAENEIGNRNSTTFEVIPQAIVSPTQGSVGDIIAVSGTGFAAGEEVSIYLKTTPVAYINSDAFGSFEGVFKVPNMTNDSYAMRVEDSSKNRALMQFPIVAGARLSSTDGHVGTEVTVSGNGFTAGAELTVRFDTTEVARASVDEDGTFNVTFEAPPGTAGQRTVTVSDGNDIAELVFTMESTPPLTPVRQLPEPGLEIRSPVTFSWGTVHDTSAPVSYTLQVANDGEFADVVLEKSGLTTTEYTPTGNERLRTSREETAYYWRVKAVDAASNESGWSAVGSFRVVASFTMPSWAIYVLIGVAVVIVGFLVYRLWRRSRSSYWD
jgi:hypothetical protein